MPDAIDQNTTIEKNKLATASAWVNLIVLTDADSVVQGRYTQNTEDITYDGNTYTQFNFGISPETIDADGSLPTRSIQVSNVTRLLDDVIYQNDGLDGWQVTVIPVNTNCLTDDFSALARTYQINGCEVDEFAATFQLGGHAILKREFPLQRYMGDYCPFAAKWGVVENFGNCECGFEGVSLVSITLSGTDPVQVVAYDHLLETGDIARFEGVGGTTELNGNTYTITKITANTIELDDTDSSDFTAFTSGGKVGLNVCNGTLKVCRQLENQTRWGGEVGLRDGTVRVV